MIDIGEVVNCLHIKRTGILYYAFDWASVVPNDFSSIKKLKFCKGFSLKSAKLNKKFKHLLLNQVLDKRNSLVNRLAQFYH